MSPRAAFRRAEGWFQVSLRSTGRGKRLLARRRLSVSSALCADGGSWGHSPSSAAVWARGAPGGASVCLPADEQTLVPPRRRSRRHPVKISVPLRRLRRSLSPRHVAYASSLAQSIKCGDEVYPRTARMEKPTYSLTTSQSYSLSAGFARVNRGTLQSLFSVAQARPDRFLPS